jgi:hypothetical protein
MSCTFNDLLVIEKANNDVGVLSLSDTEILSDSQKVKLQEISDLLDSLHEVTIDDELDAIKVALEEIRDRDD